MRRKRNIPKVARQQRTSSSQILKYSLITKNQICSCTQCRHSKTILQNVLLGGSMSSIDDLLSVHLSV